MTLWQHNCRKNSDWSLASACIETRYIFISALVLLLVSEDLMTFAKVFKRYWKFPMSEKSWYSATSKVVHNVMFCSQECLLHLNCSGYVYNSRNATCTLLMGCANLWTLNSTESKPDDGSAYFGAEVNKTLALGDKV